MKRKGLHFNPKQQQSTPDKRGSDQVHHVLKSPTGNTLASLKSHLMCTICLAKTVDRFFPCGHTFCSECILKMFEMKLHNHPDTFIFQCPQCRQDIKLLPHASTSADSESYEEASLSFYFLNQLPINYMAQDINEAFLDSNHWCDTHEDRVQDIWCWTCMISTCSQCASDDLHKSHVLELIQDAHFKAYTLTQDVSDKLDNIMTDSKLEISTLINDRQDLLNQLHSTYQRKLQEIHQEYHNLKDHINSIYDVELDNRNYKTDFDRFKEITASMLSSCRPNQTGNGSYASVISWLNRWKSWYEESQKYHEVIAKMAHKTIPKLMFQPTSVSNQPTLGNITVAPNEEDLSRRIKTIKLDK
ncbi:hypothetical protein MP638_001413 [Amoeboaphelidium occidentale]|nr:hypothetical protein MP638_001413 [Amoeboaphelidium occidentale]